MPIEDPDLDRVVAAGPRQLRRVRPASGACVPRCAVGAARCALANRGRDREAPHFYITLSTQYKCPRAPREIRRGSKRGHAPRAPLEQPEPAPFGYPPPARTTRKIPGTLI